ncbi:hypothetical protein P152DRAFT_471140 [Eremomyces bilateralis CBS 781.70]|uniref:Concanavalin A-like lectin/glucanase n=1 Tax=Eremomyces bilateralis CBS 781.70 TaxID=1392243 RepID=A0A6G1GCW7_9PEZI|nr:uncharacterized protein P152DRAFT_471140 [Eremomyces bilateralis CBS 781.70]KAF1815741.1 hypothetical protein P152DRAFT_471140 [Eremomyces bilateralis CBS 781.70]
MRSFSLLLTTTRLVAAAPQLFGGSGLSGGLSSLFGGLGGSSGGLGSLGGSSGGLGGLGGSSSSSSGGGGGGDDMAGMDMGSSGSSGGMDGMDMGGSGSSGAAPTTDGPLPEGAFIEKSLETTKVPGTQIVEMKYGPYSIGPMGMLENRIDANVKVPCTNCFITGIQADLYDDSGKSVNIDQGAWLHHMVLSLMGLGNKDLVCPVMIGTQRIFASGNERTPVRINGKYKYGIKVGAGDSMMLLYDLVNDLDKKRNYYIVMKYETTTDREYKAVSMAWLDVTGNCGTSSVKPRNGQYDLQNSGWTSSVSGRLLSATGHVHDGGKVVKLYKNGEVICTSDQIYGRRVGYTEGQDAMNPGLTHISDTTSCIDFGDVRSGDKLKIVATYDTEAHALNKMMDGEEQEIMGISQVYIGS